MPWNVTTPLECRCSIIRSGRPMASRCVDHGTELSHGTHHGAPWESRVLSMEHTTEHSSGARCSTAFNMVNYTMGHTMWDAMGCARVSSWDVQIMHRRCVCRSVPWLVHTPSPCMHVPVLCTFNHTNRHLSCLITTTIFVPKRWYHSCGAQKQDAHDQCIRCTVGTKKGTTTI